MDHSPTEAFAFLRRVGWLSDCPPDIQSALLDIASLVRLETGATLYNVEDPPGGFYGLASGCIALEAAQSDREPQMALLVHPGAWFGAGTLAGRHSRLVGARATRPSTLVNVRMHAFLRLASDRPEVWRCIAQLATENTARAIGLAEDLMLRGSRQRLAAILVRLAGLREACPPDPAIIDATQSDVAAIANLSRSVTSAHLHEFERDGAIELGRASIRVPTPSGLQYLLQQQP